MPLPFDMLAIMLYLGYYSETPIADPPSVVPALALCGAAVLAMALVSAAITGAALRFLRRPGATFSARRGVAGKAELLLRLSLVAAHILLLQESALPWRLVADFGIAVDAAGGHLFYIQFFGLLPFLLLFVAAWGPFYPLHRRTASGAWTFRSFLVNKARYNLYTLLVWLPFAFLADSMTHFLPAVPLVFLLAAWTFPALLARIWGCRPLEDAETRDLVKALEERAGARFSRVLVWEPGGGMMNAAAVGLFAPFRYLFLTPGLMRGLRRDELEAVVLHELGHVRKRHLLFYLFTSLAGINAAVLVGFLAPLETSAERFILTTALVLFYFRFVFGWLSRNMERQADLFALEKGGSPRPLANALEKLGIAAGNIRLAASWHHLGIAERVDFLRLAARHPEFARYHNFGVSRLMIAGYLSSLLLIGALALETYRGLDGGAPPPSMPERSAMEEKHWRRVNAVMPDSAAARLELAHCVARRSDGGEEARTLAGEALRLTDEPELRGSAEKLLRELPK